jgi:hypothetical protein
LQELVKEKTILQIELLKQLSQGQGGNGGLTGSQLALFAVLISHMVIELLCVFCVPYYISPFLKEQIDLFILFHDVKYILHLLYQLNM